MSPSWCYRCRVLCAECSTQPWRYKHGWTDRDAVWVGCGLGQFKEPRVRWSPDPYTGRGTFWGAYRGTLWLACDDIVDVVNIIRKTAARVCRRSINSTTRPIYRSVVVAKLLYASSAWEGFANATDRNKIQSFINKSKRNGYCSPDLPDFNSLCTSMKVDLFNKV